MAINTPNEGYTFPDEGDTSWYADLDTFCNAVDTSVTQVRALIAALSLQTAYETGNAIVTDSGNGDLSVSGTEKVSLVSSNVAADAIKLNASAGGIDVDAAGAIDIAAAGVMSFTDSSGGPHTLSSLVGGGSSAWTAIENLDVDTGTEDVDSFAVTSDGMAVWEVFVGSGANVRQHTFKAAWDYSANDITAQSNSSTVDLGDTSDLVLTVTMAAGTIKLEATAASDDWVVKGKRMSVTL